jgi:hypothetical protein
VSKIYLLSKTKTVTANSYWKENRKINAKDIELHGFKISLVNMRILNKKWVISTGISSRGYFLELLPLVLQNRREKGNCSDKIMSNSFFQV